MKRNYNWSIVVSVSIEKRNKCKRGGGGGWGDEFVTRVNPVYGFWFWRVTLAMCCNRSRHDVITCLVTFSPPPCTYSWVSTSLSLSLSFSPSLRSFPSLSSYFLPLSSSPFRSCAPLGFVAPLFLLECLRILPYLCNIRNRRREREISAI